MKKNKKLYIALGVTLCIYLPLLFAFNDFMSMDISSPSEKEIALAKESNYTYFLNYTNKVSSKSLLSAILIYSEDIEFIEKALFFYKEKGDLHMINESVVFFELISNLQSDLNCLSKCDINNKEQKRSLIKKMNLNNDVKAYLYVHKDFFYFFYEFYLAYYYFYNGNVCDSFSIQEIKEYS